MQNNQPHSWTPERIASVVRNGFLVIISGIALGIFATMTDVYYVMLIVAGALLTILIAWKFEAALILYVIIAFIPWGKTPDLAVGGSGVGKGVYVSEIMLSFLLLIWFCRYLMNVLPKRRIKAGFYIPLVFYLAYCLVNVINSFIFWDPHVNRIYQHPSVNVIELGLRILSAGGLVMIATSVSSSKWLKYISIAMMIPGIYNLLNALCGSPIPLSAPWWPLVALLPIGYCGAVAFQKQARPLSRILALIILLIAIFVIFYRSVSWVSGWLGLFACVATVAFFSGRRIFALVLLIAVIASVIAWPFIQTNIITSSEEEGDYDRFALMQGAMKYATNFPLGVGLGNYRTYNSFYYGEKWETTGYTSAHGTYAQLLAETGVPGLLLFIWLLSSGFSWMSKHYKMVKDQSTRNYLLAALGQMVGISLAAIIGDYIIPTYHNGGLTTFSATIYSWLIWGLAIAHIRLNEAEINTASKDRI